jgi:hypothetical protein
MTTPTPLHEVDTARVRSAVRLGRASALAVVALSAAYFVPLVIGLLTLSSPDSPIADPWRTAMELLILALTFPVIGLSVALCFWAEEGQKPLAVASLVFVSMALGLTFANHFTVLALSSQPAFADQSWAPLLVSFSWPSVAYAVEFVAWDVFFAIGLIFGSMIFRGPGLRRIVRVLFLLAGLVSLSGCLGVVLNNMQIRDIGIIGYAVIYPVGAAFVVALLRRPSRTATSNP